ncbi:MULTISPECIES: helix-turn-helix domain-containing protein [unclassified Crossiella]|uniref:helix-turn-helix domain-containing protein n=1 Tax=unclassified Crossiella TaxID=2620835 RepID=UPI001FFF1BAD|nr:MULTISPECIES: helix-turn-helix domain-containing protein [unclassified Crossiella]MCK2244197.1 helix-turn-helix domain-containing protein [Crossiella sp. S99.2]MCK2258001.1 helix-turn-helix domain-containing protein [Crossiella sp. S99.1]
MAEGEAREIGRRLRYWRERRKLDRKRFADLMGRSLSWLDKVESGQRNLLRLPVIDQAAEVLGIDASVLTNRAVASQAEQSVDGREVQAVREALGWYPVLPDAEGPAVSVAAVRRQAEYLDQAWVSAHFTVVAQRLPALLLDAQRASRTAVGADQLAARRVLITAYRLASSLLLKFEVNEVAWLAADRAMHVALTSDDAWSLARAARCAARAMTSSGQGPEAIECLLTMTDRVRPELPRHRESLLALYGMLYLAAAMTAAGREDSALARDMHEHANAAARRMAPNYATHNTYFGLANVQIHRVAALVRLHETGRAIEFAATIDPAEIASLSPERRANFLLDLTEAHTRSGDYRTATRLLGQVEHIAPEEVRGRPLGRGLLRALLHNTGGDCAGLVRQMASRAGVTA